LHFTLEPRLRHLQITPDRHYGDIQGMRSFFQRQAPKIAKLYGLAFPSINLLERAETNVKRDEVGWPLRLKDQRSFQ
jgi:hypothetical protein